MHPGPGTCPLRRRVRKPSDGARQRLSGPRKPNDHNEAFGRSYQGHKTPSCRHLHRLDFVLFPPFCCSIRVFTGEYISLLTLSTNHSLRPSLFYYLVLHILESRRQTLIFSRLIQWVFPEYPGSSLNQQRLRAGGLVPVSPGWSSGRCAMQVLHRSSALLPDETLLFCDRTFQ